MTKKELYDKLTASGMALAPLDSYTYKQLSSMAAPYFHEQSSEANQTVELQNSVPVAGTNRVLHFKQSGWCSELCRSYTQGYFTCAINAEYEILKKYAEKS